MFCLSFRFAQSEILLCVHFSPIDDADIIKYFNRSNYRAPGTGGLVRLMPFRGGGKNNFDDAFESIEPADLVDKQIIIEVGSAPREHEQDERLSPSLYAARCNATRLADLAVVLFVDISDHLPISMFVHDDRVRARVDAINADAKLRQSIVEEARRIVDADRRTRKSKQLSCDHFFLFRFAIRIVLTNNKILTH